MSDITANGTVDGTEFAKKRRASTKVRRKKMKTVISSSTSPIRSKSHTMVRSRSLSHKIDSEDSDKNLEKDTSHICTPKDRVARSKKMRKKRSELGTSTKSKRFDRFEHLLISLNEQAVKHQQSMMTLTNKVNDTCKSHENAIFNIRKEINTKCNNMEREISEIHQQKVFQEAVILEK